ncbi:hypothetical protein OIU78_025550 [Salix suchowensis]|nr:hypothetical protein OIU78_025550 [Salix suchowensis]
MEIVRDQEISEPLSPTGQFMSNSVLSLSIIAVMELEEPFDDSLSIIPFLKDVLLPINPRFSSIMVLFLPWHLHSSTYFSLRILSLQVGDKDGVKRWKKVEVRLSDHVNFPVFTAGMSAQFYDECFDEYLSKMAAEQFPQSQPLWEVHEDETPIRSGHSGVESLPVAITTITFSLDHIKEIKAKLGVTLNDVITGTIFLGARMYMETVSQGSGSACSTSLVLLNKRMLGGYKSVQEMLKPDSEAPWGNHFAFLKIPIPKLGDAEAKNNPLKFVINARKIIKRKRSSIGVYLTTKYLRLVARFRGPNSLMAGVTSYIGKLRVALLVEKDFIDPQKLKSQIEKAIEKISEAACREST